MNLARFSFCLSHEDPDIVKKGLLLFTKQVLQENNASLSFGYNGRGVGVFSLDAEVSEAGINQKVGYSQGLLLEYLDKNSKIEEFFVLWQVQDYGTEKELAVAHLQALAVILHCAHKSHTAECSAIVSRIVFERQRSMKSLLTSTHVPLVHAALGLLIASARCGVDGSRDIALKFMVRNAPSIAALSQKGKVVSWEVPDAEGNDTSGSDSLNTDSRCLLGLLVHTLLRSGDTEVVTACLGVDSIFRKLLNHLHKDNDETAVCMTRILTHHMLVPGTALMQGGPRAALLDAGFQRNMVALAKDSESTGRNKNLVRALDEFLDAYVSSLSSRAVTSHSLRGPLEKLLVTFEPKDIEKHKHYEKVILSDHPNLLRISINAITHTWEPRGKLDFVGSLGHLCYLLDGNTVNYDHFTELFDSLPKSNPNKSGARGNLNDKNAVQSSLETFAADVRRQEKDSMRDKTCESRTHTAVETLLSRLVPRSFGKKEFTKILSHSNAYVQRVGLLYLKYLLKAINRISLLAPLSPGALEILGIMLGSRLPELAVLLHLRTDLMQATFSPDAVAESAASYLLDILHDALELLVQAVPSFARAAGVDFSKLLEDVISWSQGSTMQQRISESPSVLRNSSTSEATKRTLDVLVAATKVGICKWMGSKEEAMKALHATIVSDALGCIKPTALTRLLVLCNIPSSAANASNDEKQVAFIKHEAITLLREVLSANHMFDGAVASEIHAWIDLAGANSAASASSADLLFRLGYFCGPSFLGPLSNKLSESVSATMCAAVLLCTTSFLAFLPHIPGGASLTGKGQNAVNALSKVVIHVVLLHGQNMSNVKFYGESLRAISSESASTTEESGALSSSSHGSEWKSLLDQALSLLEISCGVQTGAKFQTAAATAAAAAAAAAEFTVQPLVSPASVYEMTQNIIKNGTIPGENRTVSRCSHLVVTCYLHSMEEAVKEPTPTVLEWIAKQAQDTSCKNIKNLGMLSQLLVQLAALRRLDKSLCSPTPSVGKKRKAAMRKATPKRTRSSSTASATSVDSFDDSENLCSEDSTGVWASKSLESCQAGISTAVTAFVSRYHASGESSLLEMMHTIDRKLLKSHTPTALLVASAVASAIVEYGPENNQIEKAKIALEFAVTAVFESYANTSLGKSSEVFALVENDTAFRSLGFMLLKVHVLTARDSVEETGVAPTDEGSCASLRQAATTWMLKSDEELPSELKFTGNELGMLPIEVSAKNAMNCLTKEDCSAEDVRSVTRLSVKWDSEGRLTRLEDPSALLDPNDSKLTNALRKFLSSGTSNCGGSVGLLCSLRPSWSSWAGMQSAQAASKSRSKSKKNVDSANSDSTTAMRSRVMQRWSCYPLHIPLRWLVNAAEKVTSALRMCTQPVAEPLNQHLLQSICSEICGELKGLHEELCESLCALMQDSSLVQSVEVDALMALWTQARLRCDAKHETDLTLCIAEQALFTLHSISGLSRNAANAWTSLLLKVLNNYHLSISAFGSPRMTRLLRLIKQIQTGKTCVLQVPLEDDDFVDTLADVLQGFLMRSIDAISLTGRVPSGLVGLLNEYPDNIMSKSEFLAKLLQVKAVESLLHDDKALEIVLQLLSRCKDRASVEASDLLSLAKAVGKSYTGTMSYSNRLKARIVWILSSAGISPPLQALRVIDWSGPNLSASASASGDDRNAPLSVRSASIGLTLSNFPLSRSYVPQPLVALEGTDAANSHKVLMKAQLLEASDGWKNSEMHLQKLEEESKSVVMDVVSNSNDEERNQDGGEKLSAEAEYGSDSSSSDSESSASDSEDGPSDLESNAAPTANTESDSEDDEISDEEGEGEESIYEWPSHLHEDFEDVQTGESSSLDPGFWLPALLSYLLAKEPSVRRLIAGGMLALPLACLSSECPILRGCAQACLAQLYALLQEQDASKDVSFRERPQLLLLMNFTRNVLQADMVPNSNRIDGALLPAQSALFLARASITFLHVNNELYSSIGRYLLSRPYCDTKDIPLWEIVITDGTSAESRLLALRGIRDSLLAHNDHLNFCRKHAYQRLMSMFTLLSHTDSRIGHTILDILDVALTQRANSRYLLERCAIIPWLEQVTSLVSSSAEDLSRRSVANARLLTRLLTLYRRTAAAAVLSVRTDGAFDYLPSLRNCASILATQAISSLSDETGVKSRLVLGSEALKTLVLFMWDTTVLGTHSKANSLKTGDTPLVWPLQLLASLAALSRSISPAATNNDTERALALLAVTSRIDDYEPGHASISDISSFGDDSEGDVLQLLESILSCNKSGKSIDYVPQVSSFEAPAAEQETNEKLLKPYRCILDVVGDAADGNFVDSSLRRKVWSKLSHWNPLETNLPGANVDCTELSVLNIASHAALNILRYMMSVRRQTSSTFGAVTGESVSLFERCMRWSVLAYARQATGTTDVNFDCSDGIYSLGSLRVESADSRTILARLALHTQLHIATLNASTESDFVDLLRRATAALKHDDCSNTQLPDAVMEVAASLITTSKVSKLKLETLGALLPSRKEATSAVVNADEIVIERRVTHSRNFLFDAGKWRMNLFAGSFADTKA